MEISCFITSFCRLHIAPVSMTLSTRINYGRTLNAHTASIEPPLLCTLRPQQRSINLPKADKHLCHFVKLDLDHMQSKATSMVKSVRMYTLSLDWISRDFLLSKTCRWLETWRKTGWRKGRERGVWLQREGRVDSVGTHLDAALIFSYPLACQNLNVTRHLRGQGYPHEKNKETHIHRMIYQY